MLQSFHKNIHLCIKGNGKIFKGEDSVMKLDFMICMKEVLEHWFRIMRWSTSHKGFKCHLRQLGESRMYLGFVPVLVFLIISGQLHTIKISWKAAKGIDTKYKNMICMW